MPGSRGFGGRFGNNRKCLHSLETRVSPSRLPYPLGVFMWSSQTPRRAWLAGSVSIAAPEGLCLALHS